MEFWYILLDCFECLERFVEELHPQLKDGFHNNLDLNTNINEVDVENKIKNN